MAKKRKLKNWLQSLLEYVEDTEAPRLYWLWSGIFSIASAFQRKVWVNYGIENIYPNLYLCIVARPGEKKGAPVRLSKRLLEDILSPVSVDSTSKRKLTKELAKLPDTEQFMHPDGKPRRMSAMAAISLELGSFLAIDKEAMIITLTDLYDSPDVWKYDTSDKGHDFLYNVCLGVFAAATPRYISRDLPPEAFGEGFASRVIWLSERPPYKPVDWPKNLNKLLYKDLVHDLQTISSLIGEFEVTAEARALFKTWYDKIPERKRILRDERLHGNLNRLHIQVLKTSMALAVAESNELVVNSDSMGRAIDLLEDIFSTANRAFGGSGTARLGPMTEKLKMQLAILKETTMRELMQMNYLNVSKTELEEILATLEIMGEIQRPASAAGTMDQKIIKIKRDPKRDC